MLALLQELYGNYGDFRKHGVPSERKMRLLVGAMDVNGDGRIYLPEFLAIVDLTRIVLKSEVPCWHNTDEFV